MTFTFGRTLKNQENNSGVREHMSPVAWIDFSSDERDRVLTALAEPKDKGTLDELGFGIVRDAIADRLFPAVNTIQTRAKYLLFVPWILSALADGNTQAANLKSMGEARERRLIHALLHGAGPKAEGLIGKESKDTLKRLPSAIYWGSLRQLRIYRGEGSLAEHLSEIESLRSAKKGRLEGIHGEESERPLKSHQSWDPALPAAQSGMLDSSNFELSSEQAGYLREKFLQLPTVAGEPGLMQWLAQEVDKDLFAAADTPWDLLQCYGAAMPKALQRDLRHAWNFALCMQGATTLYFYFLIAARAEDRTDSEVALDAWCLALAERAKELRQWHSQIGDFWSWVEQSTPNLKRDKPFINEWLAHLAEFDFQIASHKVLVSDDVFRRFRARERFLKPGLARLTHRGPLERWEPATTAHVMTYRWAQARRMLLDIHHGIGRKGNGHA